jgi:hypothetical protein
MQIIRDRKYLYQLDIILDFIAKDSFKKSMNFLNSLDKSINNLSNMPFKFRKSHYYQLDNKNGISELMAKDIKEYLELELQNFQNGIEPIIMNQKKEQVIIHNINSHTINSTNDSNNKTNTENKKK